MKNLKKALKMQKITQVKLAEDLNISRDMLSRYARGDVQPTAPVIEKISKYLGVTTDYLLGLSDSPTNEELREQIASDLRKALTALTSQPVPGTEKAAKPKKEKPENLHFFDIAAIGSDEIPEVVPHLADEIAAGEPLRISDRVKDVLFFQQRYLKRFKKPFLITVGKNQFSMSPTILPGDLLLVDRRPVERLKKNHIYVVNSPEEGGTIKRCYHEGKTLLLVPDNTEYSYGIIDATRYNIQDIIVGTVVWIGRELV